MFRSAAVLSLTVALTGTSVAQEGPYDGHRVAQVEVESVRDLQTVLAVCEDIWSHAIGIGTLDVQATDDQLDALTEAGIAYTIAIPDLQALVDDERARLEANAQNAERGDWYADYKDIDAINTRLGDFETMRPDIAEVFDIGQTLEGRTMNAIRIATPGGGQKPAIVLNSIQHAREWVTVMANMYIAEQLITGADSNPVAQRILNDFEVIIIPVVNVDGYVFSWTDQRMWRKTRRDNGDGTFGVDPNRNWGTGWGGPGSSGNTDSNIYRGEEPFSEMCTTNLSNFLAETEHAVLHVDIHAYSQLLLEPWGFTPDLPEQTNVFRSITEEMAQAIFDVEEKVFVGGPAFRAIYPASGVAPDWIHEELDLLSWTYELRPSSSSQGGFALPPEQILPAAIEAYAGITAAADWLVTRQVGFALAADLPSEVSANGSTDVLLQVRPGLLTPTAESARLRWRVGTSGSYDSQPFSPAGDGWEQVSIPGGPCHSLVQYYFEVDTMEGTTVTFPVQGAAAPFEAVSRDVEVLFEDDFSTSMGWTNDPDDDANAGIWERGDPNGTVAQPEYDHSPIGPESCLFTGQNDQGNSGGGDVDGGQTGVVSPTFDLQAHPDARVEFWRWYSNRRRGETTADDALVVQFSDDNGQSWTTALTVGPDGLETAGGWFFTSLSVADFVTPNDSVVMRVVASDTGVGSFVEAAVDDVRVVASSCSTDPCEADLNQDGLVTSDDFFDFLGQFFAGVADFNNDGMTDSSDFFGFFEAFFAPCP